MLKVKRIYEITKQKLPKIAYKPQNHCCIRDSPETTNWRVLGKHIHFMPVFVIIQSIFANIRNLYLSKKNRMRVILFVCVLLMSVSVANAQNTTSDAIAYNDNIVAQQFVYVDAISLMMSAPLLDSAGLWSGYYQAVVMVKRCNLTIQSLQAFDGDTEFLSATKALFQYYEDSFINDYPKLLKALLMANASVAEYAEMNDIVTKIAENEAVLDAKFMAAQSAFAAKHGFTLEETENEIYYED